MTMFPQVSDHTFEDVISVVRGLDVDNREIVSEIVSGPAVARSENSVLTVNLRQNNNPAVLALIQIVSEQVLAYCQRTGTGHSSVELAECWGHVTGRGDSVPTHVHPTSFVSAVYYPEVIENSCSLRFDRPNWSSMAYQIMRYRPNSSPMTRQYIDVKPTTGLLVISPSWLPRGVSTGVIPGTRASVVFKFSASGDNLNNQWGKLLLGDTL